MLEITVVNLISENPNGGCYTKALYVPKDKNINLEYSRTRNSIHYRDFRAIKWDRINSIDLFVSPEVAKNII